MGALSRYFSAMRWSTGVNPIIGTVSAILYRVIYPIRRVRFVPIIISSSVVALLVLTVVLGACSPVNADPIQQPILTVPDGTRPNGTNTPGSNTVWNSSAVPPTPYPTRPLYSPGELVDYVAQTGDTLPALAARFNTSVEKILQANSFIPATATTMPPGMPMKIPIYYLPFWGSPHKIIPDSLFINGPAQVGFDTAQFVAAHTGWLKSYHEYVANANQTGAEVVDYVALRYSVSPRLLLALLEYQAGALSQSVIAAELAEYPLGYASWDYKGVFMQLNWAANLLNDGYYRYRAGTLLSIERSDDRLERFDPWLNAATASLHNYFNRLYPVEQYQVAISQVGFARAYQDLFGDPWQDEQLGRLPPYIPGSLLQPDLSLPFAPGNTWAYTGGPHTGWGKDQPFVALDFAPPAVAGGCLETEEWTTAVADGVIVRSGDGEVDIDLDGDGDERTGWNIFYLHVGSDGRVPLRAVVKMGDPIGHPSCEGGTSTGTHIHIARKYNGEWIPADGVLAFNLDGWVAHNGDAAYQGSLTRNTQTVTACQCSNQGSFIQAEPR